jgi:hypothetical protein
MGIRTIERQWKGQIDIRVKITLILFNGQFDVKQPDEVEHEFPNYCVCWKMRQTTFTPQALLIQLEPFATKNYLFLALLVKR